MHSSRLRVSNLSRAAILIALCLGLAATPPAKPARAGFACIWTGAVDSTWSDPGNWDYCLGFYPGENAGDTATIPNVATDPVLDVDASINALTIQSGATLSLGSSRTLTTHIFHLVGKLTGAGDLSVTEKMEWDAGAGVEDGIMSGTGTTTIAATAELVYLPKAIAMKLDGRTLDNYGAAWYRGMGDISAKNGAVVNNYGGFHVGNWDGDWGFHFIAGPGGATFNNHGTFTKSGDPAIPARIEAPFNNSGTVNIQFGMLALDCGGTHSGDFTGGDGTRLRFGFSGCGGNDTYDFTASSSIDTPMVEFSACTANISGEYAPMGSETSTDIINATVNFQPGADVYYLGDELDVGGTLNLGSGDAVLAGSVEHAGTITGDRNLNCATSYTWYGGTRSGAGATHVNGSLTLGSGATKTLNGHTFVSNGDAVWSGTGNIAGSNGAVFWNNGTFLAENNSQFTGCGSATFNNTGILTKTISVIASTTTFDVAFNNTGSVEVEDGALRFTCGSLTVPTGTLTLGGDGLEASGGLNLQGSTLNGSGILTGDVFNGGSVAPGASPGAIQIQGTYTQAPTGTLNIEIGGLSAGSGFDQLQASGSATLAGTLNVDLINGYKPTAADTFQIMAYGSGSGAFDSVNLPSPYWTISYNAGGVTLEADYPRTCWARLNDDPTDYTSVQEAVDASTQASDVVKVAGTCTGVSMRAGVTQTVYLSKTLTLQGGYTTTNWTTPDPVAHPTTLDAGGKGRVLFITGDIEPLIGGVIIANGDAYGLGGGGEDRNLHAGGGVYVVTATATISACQVHHNVAELGGGVYLLASNATVAGSEIYSNTAAVEGGGLACLDGGPAISGNQILHNTTGKSGSGLAFNGCYGATISQNTIAGNTAGRDSGGNGGGLSVEESDSVTISRNTIISNTAHYDAGSDEGGEGGGLRTLDASVALDHNLFSANQSSEAAVWFIETDATLNGDRVIGNLGLDYGSGVILEVADATFTNVVIADNQGDAGAEGGGIYVYASHARLLHTTLARNSGLSSVIVEGEEGNPSTLAMTNTLLVSHTVGIHVTEGCTVAVNGVLWHDTATPIVQESSASVSVQNEHSGDPAFAADGYHLTASSAAIGKGVDAGVAVDIDGEPRPKAPALGADEYVADRFKVHLPVVLRSAP